MKSIIVLLVMVASAVAIEGFTYSSFDFWNDLDVCNGAGVFYYPEDVSEADTIGYVTLYFETTIDHAIISIHEASTGYYPMLDPIDGAVQHLVNEFSGYHTVFFEEPVEVPENGFWVVVTEGQGDCFGLGRSKESQSPEFHSYRREAGAGPSDWTLLENDCEWMIAVGLDVPQALEPDTWAGIKASF